MLILKQTEQKVVIPVDDQEVTFTIRPALIGDIDLAYVSSRNQDSLMAGLEDDDKNALVNLRAGRVLLLQRISAWEGVYISENETAPCDLAHLGAFFGRYPGIFMQLSDQVRELDEAGQKN